jgi:para-aminobenzoate synthetase component 1
MQFQAHIRSVENSDLKYSLLDFFKEESNVILLDGNTFNGDSFDWVIAAGTVDEISVGEQNAFEELQAFHEKHKDWIFGSLSYDLKNGLEKLESNHADGIQAPALHFFLPKYVFVFREKHLVIYRHESQKEFELEILSRVFTPSEIGFNSSVKSRVSKNNYLDRVNRIKAHIQRGDIYEMNYCQEFYAENTDLNPLEAFKSLNAASKAPFSCYFKLGNTYLLSASPERFVKKDGTHIISQPIKGTRRRGLDPEEDERLKKELYEDQKERSENVMIVDLVRNDLSRIAVKDTVKVDELFGIYTFDQLHHMISTISCELRAGKDLKDIFRATFPMGSMTGAPKIRAMKLIEKFEETKRGLYSGAVGYISPEGDFDFNVVIRSIQYNALNKYLSFMVGGAITMGSDAEMEYEECLVKAKALFEVLEGKYAETVS